MPVYGAVLVAAQDRELHGAVSTGDLEGFDACVFLGDAVGSSSWCGREKCG